jgi:hypothetical protein
VPKNKSTRIQIPVVRRTRDERLENLNSVREASLEKKKELEKDKQDKKMSHQGELTDQQIKDELNKVNPEINKKEGNEKGQGNSGEQNTGSYLNDGIPRTIDEIRLEEIRLKETWKKLEQDKRKLKEKSSRFSLFGKNDSDDESRNRDRYQGFPDGYGNRYENYERGFGEGLVNLFNDSVRRHNEEVERRIEDNNRIVRNVQDGLLEMVNQFSRLQESTEKKIKKKEKGKKEDRNSNNENINKNQDGANGGDNQNGNDTNDESSSSEDNFSLKFS